MTKKVAIVHDDFVQFGGAEKLVMALMEIFPKADLYASIVSEEWKQELENRGIECNVSFMQKLFFNKRLYKPFFVFGLYSLAFESFNFSSYDVVISSSARYAHGVITPPHTKHLVYMNTSGRMIWEPNAYFKRKLLGKLLAPILSWYRQWDYVSAQRPNAFVGNSTTAIKRIKKYYGRDAEVIFPFVDTDRFVRAAKRLNEKTRAQVLQKYNLRSGNYYLIVTRLAEWKRVDIAVEAFTGVDEKLVVVGGGNIDTASTDNVIFVGRLADDEVNVLLLSCKALIMTQLEDFGIAPLEANACGKPVLAYRGGGALDTIKENETGVFFDEQTTSSLLDGLERLSRTKFNDDNIKEHAFNFERKVFDSKIKRAVAKLVDEGSSNG